MFRRGAAAPPHDVQEAVLRPFTEGRGQLFRRFVITAKGIGQTSVGVGGNVAIAQAGKLLDMRTQFLGAQRAVETEGKGADMAQ